MIVKSKSATSRRALLKGGIGLAAGAATVPRGVNAQAVDSDATLQRLTGANPNTRRILLKGGTIISMDRAVGDFAQGDILVEGQKIAAVARAIDGPGQDGSAIVIDAKDTVVIPGMVDCHRHAWEGQIRGVIPNSATIGEYMGATHQGFGRGSNSLTSIRKRPSICMWRASRNSRAARLPRVRSCSTDRRSAPPWALFLLSRSMGLGRSIRNLPKSRGSRSRPIWGSRTSRRRISSIPTSLSGW